MPTPKPHPSDDCGHLPLGAGVLAVLFNSHFSASVINIRTAEKEVFIGVHGFREGEPTMGRAGWDLAISTRQGSKSKDLKDGISEGQLKSQTRL